MKKGKGRVKKGKGGEGRGEGGKGERGGGRGGRREEDGDSSLAIFVNRILPAPACLFHTMAVSLWKWRISPLTQCEYTHARTHACTHTHTMQGGLTQW